MSLYIDWCEDASASSNRPVAEIIAASEYIHAACDRAETAGLTWRDLAQAVTDTGCDWEDAPLRALPQGA